MGDLPTSTLEDMCEFVIDCPHFTPEWTDSGFIVIRNQNIRDGRLDLSNPSFTHHDDFLRRIKRAKPQAGDIIFTREAPMGEVCMVPEGVECCVGQRQVLLRPKRDIDRRYLFFALRSQYVRHQIFWNEGTGSTVSNVRIPVLKSLRIPRLDNLESPIAELLGALDDKINLNRQTNETLEAMARAIFKDWFVDFGPTRAKAEGRPAYLASELWKLFPDALNDDDKPVGWTSRRLDDLFDVSIGRTPPRKEKQHFLPSGHGKTWLSIKNMGGLQVFAFSSDEDLAPDAVASFRVPLIPAGTVIVSFKLTVGRVAIVSKDMYSNEAIAHLVPKLTTPVSNYFTYGFMKGFDYEALGSTSSIATAVNSKSIKGIEMVVPDSNVHEAFLELAEPIFDRILSNGREVQTLAQTRDLLLPKLMSGEIRLKDAEKLTEDAL